MILVIYLQISTIFWIDGITSVSYWTYKVLMTLGRQKSINLVLLWFKSLLKSWKVTNHQVLIKFRQNRSKQEVRHYVLISINLLTLFGIWKNFHNTGRNLLLYLFVKRLVELIVVIIEGCHSYQLHTGLYPVFFSSTLTPCVEKINGDHLWWFARDRSTTDQIFCTRQLLDRNGSIMGQYISYLQISKVWLSW